MYMYFDYNCTGKYVEYEVAKNQMRILQIEDWQRGENRQSTGHGILRDVVTVFVR
jgi:hypothetical protein